MEYKVIYAVSGLNEWVDVAKKLYKELGWKPCYWITVPGNEYSVKKYFPDTIHHWYFDANRGIPAKGLEHYSHYPIDQKIKEQYQKYETEIIGMLDRFDPGHTFDYYERVRLYHKQLMYWINVVNNIKPDFVIFHSTPHILADYILYAVCVENGVETIIYTPTSILNMVYIRGRNEEIPEKLINTYKKYLQNNSTLSLSEETKKYVDKVKGDYSQAEPWYMREQRKKDRVPYFNWLGNKNTDNSISSKVTFRNLFKKTTNNNLKVKGSKFEESYMTNLQYLRYTWTSKKYKTQLKNYYIGLCDDIDYGQKYVYLPLHYQPERTTAPEGGIYANQWLMINLLSNSLPKGWFIYIKEHTSQFSSTLKGEQGRRKEFYDDVKVLTNVKFVSLDESTFDLIDNCQAVATVTGTAGWEAIVRGKPALVFGNAWYKCCEGAFTISETKDLINALNIIKEGYTIDERKAIAFLKTIEEISIKGFLDPLSAKNKKISYEEHVKELFEGLVNYVQNEYLIKE